MQDQALGVQVIILNVEAASCEQSLQPPFFDEVGAYNQAK